MVCKFPLRYFEESEFLRRILLSVKVNWMCAKASTTGLRYDDNVILNHIRLKFCHNISHFLITSSFPCAAFRQWRATAFSVNAKIFLFPILPWSVSRLKFLQLSWILRGYHVVLKFNLDHFLAFLPIFVESVSTKRHRILKAIRVFIYIKWIHFSLRRWCSFCSLSVPHFHTCSNYCEIFATAINSVTNNCYLSRMSKKIPKIREYIPLLPRFHVLENWCPITYSFSVLMCWIGLSSNAHKIIEIALS